MSNIPQPSEKIDWTNLGFKLQATNGHVEYHYQDGKWSEGKWVEDPWMKLHVGSVALNYGQSMFEGLKAFRGKDGQIRIFRPTENFKRMQHGAEAIYMPELPEEIFVEACRKVVAKNMEFVPPYAPNAARGALYLRPLFFGSGPEILLGPAPSYTFLVFATPVGALYPAGKEASAIPAIDALIVDEFDRAAPKGTGTSKLAGNYAPVFKWTAMAKKQGYGVTMHLDSKSNTMVDEFSTSNCLFITAKGNDVTLVVPKSDSILASITTKSIIGLAETVFKWKVEQRPVAFEEVVNGVFNECAAAGTAAIITPVKSISYKNEGSMQRLKIGDGESAGPNFVKLMNYLTGLQSGDNEDAQGWLWPKDGVKAE